MYPWGVDYPHQSCHVDLKTSNVDTSNLPLTSAATFALLYSDFIQHEHRFRGKKISPSAQQSYLPPSKFDSCTYGPCDLPRSMLSDQEYCTGRRHSLHLEKHALCDFLLYPLRDVSKNIVRALHFHTRCCWNYLNTPPWLMYSECFKVILPVYHVVAISIYSSVFCVRETQQSNMHWHVKIILWEFKFLDKTSSAHELPHETNKPPESR